MAPHDTWPQGFVDSAITRLQEPAVLASIATIAVILVTTRALSGGSSPSSNGCRLPPTPAYWVPGLGHWPQLTICPNGLLDGFRRQYSDGVFSLKIMGRTHSYIFRPSWASVLLDKAVPNVRAASSSGELTMPSFGLQEKDLSAHDAVLSDSAAPFRHRDTGPSLENMATAAAARLKTHIADFVTFNSYHADQMDWEKLAGAEATETEEGEAVMEVDLFELIRAFTARTASAALFGTDFAENFPEAWPLLWRLENDIHGLSPGMPAWAPLPQPQRARATRKKLLSFTHEFEEALDKFKEGQDPGVKWQDVDNASDLVKDRAARFREAGMSLDGRAACDLALLWEADASASPLVAWMLFELSRDPILLEQVREEVAPFFGVVQPKNDFPTGVWIAPIIEKLDLDGLFNKCLLLRAAYVETVRLYTGATATRLLKEDVLLGGDGEKYDAYLLKKGTYAHVPQELHYTDPVYFPEPTEWQAERHIKHVTDHGGSQTRVVDMATVKPFGTEFAAREVLLYTAVIISMYEIRPAGGGAWAVPKTVKPVATKLPRKPIRVAIKRRIQPSEK